ncbi:ABC transporter permease [Paenibacillus nasutitermitis]|uniref:Choline ABC transporter permease n=1 Tax=Paenibacillus nasutitermitis TaxID=1652958 RepID=A0A917DUR9_9BACL|nr:ABC transporter permease [Paenibacillus nasutitermitis]GGD72989.1 choline ABC transporter permease [Paenibacillus nasutitermitis]
MPKSNFFYTYLEFLQERYLDILTAIQQHLVITAASMLLGILVAVPLGIFLSKNKIKWLHTLIFTITNIFQTIPSLALLAILIPLMGIGMKPAIFALFLYSLLPILRNTYEGFNSVDPAMLESARGMGFNATQRLLQIQLPLSFPYIMSGIRVTTVYIISWTTLAALIGAGGLGELIVSGIGVNKKELIITGAASAILLAFLADLLFGAIERWSSIKTNIKIKLQVDK